MENQGFSTVIEDMVAARQESNSSIPFPSRAYCLECKRNVTLSNHEQHPFLLEEPKGVQHPILDFKMLPSDLQQTEESKVNPNVSKDPSTGRELAVAHNLSKNTTFRAKDNFGIDLTKSSNQVIEEEQEWDKMSNQFQYNQQSFESESPPKFQQHVAEYEQLVRALKDTDYEDFQNRIRQMDMILSADIATVMADANMRFNRNLDALKAQRGNMELAIKQI